jgi:hypothetical protein
LGRAIVWAVFGHVDIIATASGKIVITVTVITVTVNYGDSALNSAMAR